MAEERVRQAVAAARAILEAEGWSAVTMRRLAAELGIRAPSLYKHLPDKAAVEIALIATGLEEMGAALAGGGPDLAGVAAAYRRYALAHPHLYALMTAGPLPRERLPAGLEERAAAALEIAGRFPPGADLDAAWAAMAAAFA